MQCARIFSFRHCHHRFRQRSSCRRFSFRVQKKRRKIEEQSSLFSSLRMFYHWQRKKKIEEQLLVVLFFSNMLSFIEKKKNRKTILVVLFFNRISSSLSSTSSFVISKSSLETQLFSSFSSFMFKNIVMMSEAFVKNVVNFFESRRDENFLTELIHNAISSFVLSFRSFFFVSFFFALLSFVSFVSLSFFDASRSRKRVRELFSSMSRKRIDSARNKCECIMSRKWLERLTQANRIENVRQTKHLLNVLYYLKKQICKNHINQMKRLYDLLSIEDFEKMKDALWDLLKFEKNIEIFKIKRSHFFEISKSDD